MCKIFRFFYDLFAFCVNLKAFTQADAEQYDRILHDPHSTGKRYD